MKKPRLTIGLPIYNAEKFLKNSLDSILSQDFTDFQVFIFDNCSEDSTPEICREYQSKDKRFNYVKNEVNVGAIKNFNNAVMYSDTEFFVWLAHDDSWEPTFLSKCIKKLDENQQAVLCCTGTNYMDLEGNIISEMQDLDRGLGVETLGLEIKQKIALLWSKCCWEVIYGVYRTDFIKSTNLLSYSYGPDVCFLTGLLITDDIICVKERLFNYRFVIKSMEQYQSCFFSNDKYVDKPMTENYESLFRYVFNLKIPNALKLETSEYLLSIILSGSDRYKVFSENSDIKESNILRTILLAPVIEENLKKDLLYINESKKLDLNLNEISEELKDIEKLIQEGNLKLSNLAIKGLEQTYNLNEELFFLRSVIEFKLGNIKESLFLTEKLLSEKHTNILLNNKAVMALKNNNLIESTKILKELSLNSYNDTILDNSVKLFKYLGDYDSIQEISNVDINKKVLLTKDILEKSIETSNNRFEIKPVISVILINTSENISLLDQVKDISLQSIHSHIEIIVVSEKNSPINKDLELKEVFYSESLKENIIHGINNAIKESNGKLITLCKSGQSYHSSYFKDIVDLFNSDDYTLGACYSNLYSTYDYTSDKTINFSPWNRDIILASKFLTLEIPIVWRSSLHNIYGYLSTDLTHTSTIEFLIRVSQTHTVKNSGLYSGYLDISSDENAEFEKQYMEISKKYISAINNKEILHLKNGLPDISIIENYNLQDKKISKDFKDFYILDDNFKAFNEKDKYLIFYQKINVEDISTSEVISINRRYDQIWVNNDDDKENYIYAGFNKNKIKVLNLENNEIDLSTKIKKNIINLSDNDISRLNIENKKTLLINKGFEYFKNKEYRLAEECFYELAINYRLPDYFFNLGVCEYHQEKYDESIDSLSTALELGLISSDLYIYIARALEKTGDTDTAKDFYKKATELTSIYK